MSDLPEFYNVAVDIERMGHFKHVKAQDMIAVCMQESHGIPTFQQADTLYRINSQAAVQGTGVSALNVQAAFTIKDGPWQGKIAKFRFEPGYWQWVKNHELLDPGFEVVMSSSIGIAQQMMRWFVGETEPDSWAPLVYKFMGSLTMQMDYLAGNLEMLLRRNNDDLFLAYKEYNSGNAKSMDEAVINRANHVVAYRQQAMKELGR